MHPVRPVFLAADAPAAEDPRLLTVVWIITLAPGLQVMRSLRLGRS